MEADRPLLDHDRIARAAEGMISCYGKAARAESDRRAQVNQAAALHGQAD